jgi:hypothetical protein
MRAYSAALSVAGALVAGTALPRAAVEYPLALTLEAQVKSGVTRITSTLSIRVDRAMDDRSRTRVTDALKYGGYANFVTALRPMPAVGEIATASHKVEVRYTREEEDGGGRRLIVVADRPLFFLSADPAKARTGYELTVVDLRIDPGGATTGTMAAAARVKPSPNGVVLDNYAESLVELKGSIARK